MLTAIAFIGVQWNPSPSNACKTWGCLTRESSTGWLGGGFPCKPFSALAQHRPNFTHAEAFLFQHLNSVGDMVQRVFPHAQVWRCGENVASMELQVCRELTRKLALPAYFADPGDVGVVRRPRVYFFDWKIHDAPNMQCTELEQGLRSIRFVSAPPMPISCWADKGWRTAASPPHLPVVTTPLRAPESSPPGFSSAEPEALDRWAKGDWRSPLTSTIGRAGWCVIPHLTLSYGV